MGQVGELWADAGLHVDKASFSEYASMLKQAEGQIGNMSSEMQLAMTSAFTVPAAAVVGIAAYGSTLAASYEKTQLQLEGLLGSQQKAGEMMKWLSDFAATTPFEFPELAETSAKLIGAGMDAKAFMTIIGDVAAGTGKSIDQVTEAFIDAQSGEWERLKELQIQHVEITKSNFAQLGATADQVGLHMLYSYDASGKKIVEIFDKSSKEAVEAALTNISVEKFAGSMDKVANSLAGKWSTIKDNMKNSLVDIIGFEVGEEKATGLYAILLKLADVAITVTDKFSNMSEPMQTFVLIAVLGGAAALALGAGFVVASAAGITATGVMAALGVAVNAVLWPAALIVGTLALVAAGLVYLDQKTGIVSYSWRLLKDIFIITMDGISRAWDIFKTFILNGIDEVKQAFLDMIPESWLSTASSIWNGATTQFANMGNNVHNTAMGIQQDHNNIGTSAQTAGSQVTGATGQMIAGYNGAGASVLGMGANTQTATGQMISGMNAAGGAAGVMGGQIAGAVPSVNSLTGAVGGATGVNQAYAASFIYVANQANAAASTAISAANRIGSAIKTNISQVGELEALAGKWNTRAKIGITSSGGDGKGEGSVKIKTPANMMTQSEYNNRVANQTVYNNNLKIQNNYEASKSSTSKTKRATGG